MIRRPPRSTRTDTLFPYTTLFRSAGHLDRRQGLPAARDDRARAGREDIAAFEQRRDVRVVLPLLEGLPRLEFRIAVIKAAHVAQRDPVLVEVIEEAAAVGVRVERPSQRLDPLARLHAPGRHLPQLLDADRIGQRDAVGVEAEALDPAACRWPPGG